MGQTVLTEDQKKVIELVKKTPEIAGKFYLTGGTVLAGFYLRHRYSDDFDFFTELKEFPEFEVEKFADAIRQEILSEKAVYRRIHDRRIFFFKKEEELKVEFTYYPFKRFQPAEIEGLAMDSLQDIAANKLMALFDRIEPKDFVDLYFILKETDMTLDKIRELVEQKFHLTFEPFTLGTELAKVSVVKNLPKMIKPLTIEELKRFFAEEAKKLGPEIFKGVDN